MYRKYNDATGYLLISVGSGLSPMVGLYNAILDEHPEAHIAHLFGERYMSHVLPSVHALCTSSQTDATHHGLYLSREEYLPKGRHTGYIHAGIPTALTFLEGRSVEVFLCGKPEMVDEALQRLLEA
jgi:ferredoxin-NADP reductase